MNKAFQKASATLAVICALSSILVGCGSKNPAASQDDSGAASSFVIGDEQTPTAVVTDVDLSNAELHEVISPQQFTEGEVIDNPYYKRTTDENGTPVFAVIKASDGQPAYLPFSETTVYHTESGTCYFGKKGLSCGSQIRLWMMPRPMETSMEISAPMRRAPTLLRVTQTLLPVRRAKPKSRSWSTSGHSTFRV